MRKLLLLVLGLSLILSACMPAFLEQTVKPAPSAVAASPTAIPASSTPVILPSATPLPTHTSKPTSTPLPPPTATASATALPPTTSVTGTATTATPGPGTPSLTFTPVTYTATLGFQSYGTLPPLVPSGKIMLSNRSHAQAYISLQCINKEGTLSIMEFPVSKYTEVKVPSGKCDYVAWVGGRQFTGKFSLDTGGQRTITLYKNRIKIK